MSYIENIITKTTTKALTEQFSPNFNSAIGNAFDD